MGLNWKISAIENFEDLCWTPQPDGTVTLKPVTEVIIRQTMVAGFGPDITNSNWTEYAIRMEYIQRVYGPLLRRTVTDPNTGEFVRSEPIYIEPADIKAHIGLTVNVPMETRTKFLKRINDAVLREYEYRIQNNMEMIR